MSSEGSIRLVAPGLVAGATPQLRLLGGRRKSDGKMVFPLPAGHEAERYESVELPPQGVLWSYTVQRFRPKPPYRDFGEAEFSPYAVGYIDLGSIIVEARLVAADPTTLEIGQPMVLTLLRVFQDEAGEPVYSYAFEQAP